MKEVKRRLNVKLKRHLAGPHVFPHEFSAFIYTSYKPAQGAGNFAVIFIYLLFIDK